METSLHRELKRRYADDDSENEVVLGSYRIDAVRDETLIEVQCASLAAIRPKIRDLTKSHDVIVVKPVVIRQTIVRQDKKGRELSRRKSPLRGTDWDLFLELVHFKGVFPHPRLTLEMLLVEIEDIRGPRPKTGFTRRRRDKSKDRRLVTIYDAITLKTSADLLRFVPDQVADEFDTGELAKAAEVPRWLAQKAAYCFRYADAVETIGKRGNALVYKRAA